MCCPSCQHENPEGARFCHACRTKLESRCPQCTHVNPSESRFCNECGMPLARQLPVGSSQLSIPNPQPLTPGPQSATLRTTWPRAFALSRRCWKRGETQMVSARPSLLYLMGKSRLIYEFKLTSQSGCVTLEAYSVSHGKASPSLLVIELLKIYFQRGGAVSASGSVYASRGKSKVKAQKSKIKSRNRSPILDPRPLRQSRSVLSQGH
jgi:hypothetical protein